MQDVFEMATVHGFREWPCYRRGPFAIHRPATNSGPGEGWRISLAVVGFAVPNVRTLTRQEAAAICDILMDGIDYSGVKRGENYPDIEGLSGDVSRAMADKLMDLGYSPVGGEP